MSARLPLADRLLYAVGSLGNAALFWSMTTWLLYFYAPPESTGLPRLMPIALVGLALAAGRVIEAFDDPLIGWWSDRTRSRWGRRIPFLLFGTPILGLSFWLLWRPPLAEESLLNAIYFFVVLELFFFANTIVSAPYEALQAEIATTSVDRVSLGAWKVFFGAAGAGLAFVGTGLLIPSLGFAGMGLVVALIAMAALYLTLFGLWRRGVLSSATAAAEAQPALLESIRATLKHRPFLALAASFLLFSVGYSMLVQTLPFYVAVVVGGPDPESRVSLYSSGVIALVVLMLPALSIAARRWGKRAVYATAMLVLGGYLPLLGIAAFEPLAPGVSLMAQSVAAIWLSGAGFAALFVLPGALMADVVDDDARRSGTPRAAVYYGMLKTLEKLAFAAAAALGAILLQVFGYSSEQSLGIRLTMPVAGGCVLLGFAAFFIWYHLRDDAAAARPQAIAARVS
ncbi:MAG: MFS transporter [Thermoleophilaceae bacterium]